VADEDGVVVGADEALGSTLGGWLGGSVAGAWLEGAVTSGVATGVDVAAGPVALGVTTGNGRDDATTAAADALAEGGRSIPPRWTTNPNETPAETASTARDTAIARGTAGVP